MSVRHRIFRKTSLGLTAVSVLGALSLAVAPTQAEELFPLPSTGNLFVANQTANTIHEFSPTGVDLGTFASTGLNGPTGLAFDQAGNLYVSNINGNTIREFSPSGADLGNFATTGLNNPAGLAFDPKGNLYVSNRGDGTIREFSRSGTDLGYFATTGMTTPVGLSFSPEPEDENGDD